MKHPVPTVIAQTFSLTHARNFALRAVAWSLGLFGLVRLNWFQARAVLPLTSLQSVFAQRLFGQPALPLDVTVACSGADALALCLGTILAFPARWRTRIAGAGGGIALILALNVIRIGTLGRLAGSRWFDPMHLYVWPAVLTLAIAGYVFSWMQLADVRRGEGAREKVDPFSSFVKLTAVCVVIFMATSPLYLSSAAVLAVAAFIARGAAFTLGHLGVYASAAGSVVWTERGGYLITQECITTPLIPVYVAGVLAYAPTWRQRGPALAITAPLFVCLGIARVLVVALPAAIVASPLFLIHAFYQLLVAGCLIFAAAVWSHGTGATAWRRALLAAFVGSALVYWLARPYAQVMNSMFASERFFDPQGALAFLPAFQIGLYVALCMAAFVASAWRRLFTGIALLVVSHLAIFAALHAAAGYAEIALHVTNVRAWSLATPLLVAALMSYDRPRD